MSNLIKRKERRSKEHSPIRHMLHMVLCCGLPIIIIFAIPYIAGISPAIAGVLGFIAPFICPIMMGGMFFMMFRGNKHSCCDETKVDNTRKITENS